MYCYATQSQKSSWRKLQSVSFSWISDDSFKCTFLIIHARRIPVSHCLAVSFAQVNLKWIWSSHHSCRCATVLLRRGCDMVLYSVYVSSDCSSSSWLIFPHSNSNAFFLFMPLPHLFYHPLPVISHHTSPSSVYQIFPLSLYLSFHSPRLCHTHCLYIFYPYPCSIRNTPLSLCAFCSSCLSEWKVSAGPPSSIWTPIRWTAVIFFTFNSINPSVTKKATVLWMV